MLPKDPMGFRAIVVWLFALCILVTAAPEDEPIIGVVRDFDRQEDLVSYSSVLKFKTKMDLDSLRLTYPNRLINLARVAWDEMALDHRQKRVQSPLPAVMVAFASGTEIIFASSMTGDRAVFVQEPTSPDDPITNFDDVRRMLRACQTGIRPNHNFAGRCGEPNAVDIYLSRHGGYTQDENGPIRGTMVAWNGNEQTVVKPCDDDQTANGRYGCNTFMTTHFDRVDLLRSGTADQTDQDKINDVCFPLQHTWRGFSCSVPRAGSSISLNELGMASSSNKLAVGASPEKLAMSSSSNDSDVTYDWQNSTNLKNSAYLHNSGYVKHSPYWRNSTFLRNDTSS